jgi:hypothetical protein
MTDTNPPADRDVCTHRAYGTGDVPCGRPRSSHTHTDPLGDGEGWQHSIQIDAASESIYCLCGFVPRGDGTHALTNHLVKMATAVLSARVGELEEQIANVRARLDEQRGATRVAAGAADRFRDVLSEVLGHPEENPGDDVLVTEVRKHFGCSGPEPTRWRDFLTGARAQIDQIEADHAAPDSEMDSFEAADDTDRRWE